MVTSIQHKDLGFIKFHCIGWVQPALGDTNLLRCESIIGILQKLAEDSNGEGILVENSANIRSGIDFVSEIHARG